MDPRTFQTTPSARYYEAVQALRALLDEPHGPDLGKEEHGEMSNAMSNPEVRPGWETRPQTKPDGPRTALFPQRARRVKWEVAHEYV